MPPSTVFLTVFLIAPLHSNDEMPVLTVDRRRVALALRWLQINNPQVEYQFRHSPHFHLFLHASDNYENSVDPPTTTLLQDAFSFHAYILTFSRPL
ncbi:hypothetical protein B0H10DRAFT_2233318 [Mycena sp. CBHHK59/15]|nr:hypothetical protein B0H10DRAFT_2233318 [Mycena sp. CBHHK59/15]